MTAFNKLLIAGEVGANAPASPRPGITAQALAQRIRQKFGANVQVHCPTLEPGYLGKVVREPAKVLSYREVADLANWAEPGHITYLLAHHEDPETYAPWGSLPQLVRHWAGDSGGESDLAGALARARTRTHGRRLRVLTTTDRPLRGLTSALGMRPDLTPSQLTQGVLSEINALARILDQPNNAARIPLATGLATAQPTLAAGSGAGWGIGALALALGGQVLDAWEAMARLTNLHHLPATDLAVALCGPLHSQTVGYSLIPILSKWAQARAIPLVVFTPETTLARFEAAQWGIHHTYRLKPGQWEGQILRILTGTWMR